MGHIMVGAQAHTDLQQVGRAVSLPRRVAGRANGNHREAEQETDNRRQSNNVT
jgi:hypothetical protein